MVMTWKWADVQGNQGTKSTCQVSVSMTGRMTMASLAWKIPPGTSL